MFFSFVLWWNHAFVHPLLIDVVTAMFRHSWLDSEISVEDNAAWLTPAKICKSSSRWKWNCVSFYVDFWHITAGDASLMWRGGAVGRASDLRFIGYGFESCLGTIAQWPCASYLHLCTSVTEQYNLVPVKGRWRSEAGKVTVCLAMHWQCVIDF